MTEKHLVIIDIDKIQDYIFRNIKLKPIVSASLLIAQLTSHPFCKAESVLKGFVEVDKLSNLTSGNQYFPLFFGGGNIKIFFTTSEDSCKFIEDMQKVFIINAPGATFSNVVFRFSGNFGSAIIENAEKELQKIKQSKLSRIIPGTNPLFDLCDLCGTYPSGDPHPYVNEKHICENCFKTLESFKKFSHLNNHDVLLKKFYDEFKARFKCEFIDEFDEIKDDKGYLAVITMDANDIGDTIKGLPGNKKNNDECVNELRAFSKDLNENIISILLKSMEGLFAGGTEKVPFRPIIIGGDDICLAIAGDKAITYVCKFIEELKKNIFCKEHKITFSIGISFVKSHYPFSFAHKLSEQLLKNAKSKKSQGNTIDWEILNTSTFENLSMIRNEQYKIKDNVTETYYVLTYKPYNFKDDDHRNFLKIIDASKKLREILKNAKFKELRQIVRKERVASNFEFRKIMSKLSDDERKEVIKALEYFMLSDKDVWLRDVNGILYNNFLDMVETYDFIE